MLFSPFITAIFELDIKPSLKEALADKVADLHKIGMNEKDIAKTLGVSLEKLSKLI